ncbi:fluoride efflux transporter CrcB [Paracoccus fistulariae]|uniref:Fluoride-specific ion channel FluC n=1 Tax=Paracoccus fistulariae TaxID=658446 RepID=A0ABY7SJ92_9RHOB|nr:fluoride efflux transporter CrcB [Paracoccus fistulariae]MDB6182921.1 fluoride efflux transporter CrcB [Paracoccus fistulariae]WCR06881.1 fluoride efflux transporter CrcB [Paracoccus fistulariae]
MMNAYLQVALGGAAGAMARFAVSRMAALWMPGFPAGTLIVNVLGSFAMGLLSVWMMLRIGTAWAPLLLTGLLGGFTTFSAFSLDALTLWERGQGGAAAGYVLLSVIASLIAVLAGAVMGRGIWA